MGLLMRKRRLRESETGMRRGIRWSFRAFFVFFFVFQWILYHVVYFLVVWKAKVGSVDVGLSHLGLCGNLPAHTEGRTPCWPMQNLSGTRNSFSV